MDFFGIGAAIRGAVAIYFRSARGTGRSTQMRDSLKNGDRVVFTNGQEAERFKRQCRERNINVECMVVDYRYPQKIFDRGRAAGRTILDHDWVEKYYLRAIENAGNDIKRIQELASSPDKPPPSVMDIINRDRWNANY